VPSSRARAALTPDTVPATKRALLFDVPYSEQWKALIVGAVAELAPDYRWELFGAATIEECQQTIGEALLSARWDTSIGLIAPFMTAVAPDGWLLCDGTLYLESDYPLLAAVIDPYYKTPLLPDGKPRFVTPDLRGRAVIGSGQGSGLTLRLNNSVTGTETHALTPGQMPAHTHGMAHNHAYSQSTYLPGLAFFPGELPVVVPPAVPLPAVTGPSSALVTGNAGSGFAHPNMQPSYALNWYVRAR